jgi:hypothetical protein
MFLQYENLQSAWLTAQWATGWPERALLVRFPVCMIAEVRVRFS